MFPECRSEVGGRLFSAVFLQFDRHEILCENILGMYDSTSNSFTVLFIPWLSGCLMRSVTASSGSIKYL